MEPLYQLMTALLSAHAPWWLLAIVVAGVVLRQVGPIRLNLSIGDRTGEPVQAQPKPALMAGRRSRLPLRDGFPQNECDEVSP